MHYNGALVLLLILEEASNIKQGLADPVCESERILKKKYCDEINFPKKRNFIYRFLGALFGRDVEVDSVLPHDGVGDPVAVVVHGAEAAAARYHVRVVVRVAELGALRGLGSRPPSKGSSSIGRPKQSITRPSQLSSGDMAARPR